MELTQKDYEAILEADDFHPYSLGYVDSSDNFHL